MHASMHNDSIPYLNIATNFNTSFGALEDFSAQIYLHILSTSFSLCINSG